MAEAEDVVFKEPISSSEVVLRLVYLCLCLVLFSGSYAAGALLSLPLPVPENMISLLGAIASDAFFSQKTLVLFAIAVFWGRPLDKPSPPKGRYLDFPGWLLKQPFAGICLGVTIFISPLLIAIGFKGIAYMLAAIFVLYSTPRLLGRGLGGAALLLTAWALAGFFLAKLAFFIPPVKNCESNTSLKLHSGVALPCEYFVFLEQVNGLVIRHQQTSVFVKMEDFAPSTSETLGMEIGFRDLRFVD